MSTRPFSKDLSQSSSVIGHMSKIAAFFSFHRHQSVIFYCCLLLTQLLPSPSKFTHSVVIWVEICVHLFVATLCRFFFPHGELFLPFFGFYSPWGFSLVCVGPPQTEISCCMCGSHFGHLLVSELLSENITAHLLCQFVFLYLHTSHLTYQVQCTRSKVTIYRQLCRLKLLRLLEFQTRKLLMSHEVNHYGSQYFHVI